MSTSSRSPHPGHANAYDHSTQSQLAQQQLQQQAAAHNSTFYAVPPPPPVGYGGSPQVLSSHENSPVLAHHQYTASGQKIYPAINHGENVLVNV